MIGKTIIGRSFKGLINYLVSKVEKGEGEILEARGARESKREMISDFNLSRQINEKLTRCVWHTSLSFSEEDALTNEKLLEISRQWMEGMGIVKTQFAIIKHTDNHPHVHIVASRIGDDGKTISDSNNWKRSESICRQLEEKYNLRRLPEVRQEKKINHSALRGRDAFKSECHLALQELLRSSKSIDQFVSLIKEKRIDCEWKYNQDGTVRGLSFSRDKTKLKASDINRIYSAKNIVKYLDRNKEQSERKTISHIKSAGYEAKQALYEFDGATRSKGEDDDIIRIDRIINPVIETNKKIRYGR
jgi:hypothetical protein